MNVIDLHVTVRVALAIALTAWAPAVRAQNLLVSDADQQRHLSRLWGDRAATFQAAWLAAPEDVRTRGAEALAALRHSGAPRGVWPAMAELSGALRVMRGEVLEEVRIDNFAHQVDALDLQLSPGAFSAAGRDASSRPSIGVRVYSTGGPRPAVPVQLGLTWIAEDGTRTFVRQTEVEPGAWTAPGFEVFVTPPDLEPGTWLLEPSLTLAGRTLTGQPVPVECVERLTERLGALRELDAAELGPGALLLRYQFELLLSHGLRLPGGLSAARALELLESYAAGGEAAAGLPRPGAGGVWTWEPAPRAEHELRRVLLVPVGSQEEPARPLFGPDSESWLALGRALDAALVCVPMTRQPPQWDELLAATRASHPGLDLIVVARAEVAVRLRLLRMIRPDVDWGLAGLVLSGVSLAPIGGPGTGPTLQFAPGMERSTGTYPESASGDLGRSPFLAEPWLPGAIEAWVQP